jgi:hypothetical protein
MNNAEYAEKRILPLIFSVFLAASRFHSACFQ